MPAQTLEELAELFVTAFNAGDSESIADLYEPGAAFETQPGQIVSDPEARRQGMEEYLALKGTLTLETKRIVQAGDLALTSSAWTLTATDPEGKPLTMSGQTVEVSRRQPDGTWRFAIDLPNGV